MDVLKKFKGLSESPAPDGQDSKKDSGTKSKLLSTWYNMKYGKAMFSLESNNTITMQSPVWLLGQCYHRKMRQRIHVADQATSIREVESGITAFYQDFGSKLWMTYRKNYEEFKNTKINTDCGWGCMIRSGQMLVANAILQLKLGRQWRWIDPSKFPHMAVDACDELMHKKIIRLFGDTLESPLSIHNFMEIAENSYSKKPGDWFGPTVTAHLIKQVVEKNRENCELLKNFNVYVATDNTIYKEDVYSMCKITKEINPGSGSFDSLINLDEYSIIDPNELMSPIKNSSNNFELNNGGTTPYFLSDCDNIHVENEVKSPTRKLFIKRCSSVPSLTYSCWKPVLILIPLKLGRDEKLNPLYSSCLKSFLATDTCLGIMGGKPKHSLYFIGFQGDFLLHLDPHLSQDKVDLTPEDFNLDSYHSKNPRKLHFSKMDPSCCVGFLLENEKQFEGWCEMASELAKPSSHRHAYPIFTIAEEGSNKSQNEFLSQIQQLDSIDEAGIDAASMIPHCEEDEFVFL